MDLYICAKCLSVLDKNDFVTKYDNLGLSCEERLGFPGEAYNACPRCGGDEHEWAKKCCFCGEIQKAYEMRSFDNGEIFNSEQYACLNCQQKLLDTFDWYMCHFTDNERALISELKDGEAL